MSLVVDSNVVIQFVSGNRKPSPLSIGTGGKNAPVPQTAAVAIDVIRSFGGRKHASLRHRPQRQEDSIVVCCPGNVLAADCEGKNITSIEGLTRGDELHPVQQSFLDHGAVQCGFCMPGMIMSSKALLDKNPEPSQAEIERALDGNLCRCAGYLKIFEAVRHAGGVMKDKKTQGNA